MGMAIYTTELLTDRDYNIPEGRLPLEYAVDTANKAKTHSENAEVHVTAEEKAAWNDTVSRINSSAPRIGTGKVGILSASLGSGADASGYSSVALGVYSHATGRDSFSVLGGSFATGESSLSIGATTEATKKRSTALGCGAKSRDPGVMAFASWNDDATKQTTLYLIGAGSSLATKYENGEACLGYVTKNTDGTIVAAGTRKLSELLTNNTTFAPASLDLEAEPPRVFLPTGATDPIEDLELPTDMEQPQEQA